MKVKIFLINISMCFQPLKVFVFDDTDPEQASYIGIADIPLIPLAHNKAIKGLFELKAANGRVSGTIELEMRWQFTYVPPKGLPLTEKVRTALNMLQSVYTLCTDNGLWY